MSAAKETARARVRELVRNFKRNEAEYLQSTYADRIEPRH